MLSSGPSHPSTSYNTEQLWSRDAMHGAYTDWREYEESILWERFGGSKVLDIGCGEGRLLAKAGSIIRNYVGVDSDSGMIEKARSRFKDVIDADFVLRDYRDLLCFGDALHKPHFDLTICIGNSLGCFQDSEQATLQACAPYTDRLFFSVMKASDEVLHRRVNDYYRRLKIPCRVNISTHTIYSDAWGASRAYSFDRLKDIGSCVRDLGFMEPWIIEVPPLGYAVYTERAGLT